MKLRKLILGLLAILSTSCTGNKQNKMNDIEQFEWQGTMSCPVGYPVDVYEGGIIYRGGSTSLYLGTHTGIAGWGIRKEV